MGYAHGKKWNYKELEKETLEVMRTLGIDRMPSRSEIHSVTNSYKLITAIGRFGGFLKVANKMGIGTKGRCVSYKWSDDKVKEEIEKVMHALNLKRMPSRTEILSVMENGALSNKISKSYGYYGWADKLNLEIKNSETSKAMDKEKEVSKMIKKHTGLKSKITKIKAPYDILVENKVMIEVKYSGGYNDEFFSANLYDGLQKANILIFICRNEVIGDKNLVIPSHHLQGITQLAAGKKSKYDKYINRWDYITKFNDFLKSI